MKVIKIVNVIFLLFIFCTANVHAAGQIITKVKKIGVSLTGGVLFIGTGTAYDSSCSSSTLALVRKDTINFDEMYSLLLLAQAADKGVLLRMSSECVTQKYPKIVYIQIQP